ncbi:Clp protease N-terminal domain-containing protein, partial [Streptomyces sp. NPDC001919]
LLAVVAADPESRAAEVLRRAGVDPGTLSTRAGARAGDLAGGGAAALAEGSVPWADGESSQQV